VHAIITKCVLFCLNRTNHWSFLQWWVRLQNMNSWPIMSGSRSYYFVPCFSLWNQHPASEFKSKLEKKLVRENSTHFVIKTCSYTLYIRITSDPTPATRPNPTSDINCTCLAKHLTENYRQSSTAKRQSWRWWSSSSSRAGPIWWSIAASTVRCHCSRSWARLHAVFRPMMSALRSFWMVRVHVSRSAGRTPPVTR